LHMHQIAGLLAFVGHGFGLAHAYPGVQVDVPSSDICDTTRPRPR
jgi:hypothetical protein